MQINTFRSVSASMFVTCWYWLKTIKRIGDDTKGTAHRSPNCIRKTRNTFRVMRVSVPLLKFCGKLLHHAKFHWNRPIGCWVEDKKLFSIRRPFAILNSKIFAFGYVTVIEFQICCCLPNFIKIGYFLLTYGDLTICNMVAVHHVEFLKFS